MKAKLNIIIGSTRPGRAGPVVAKWFESLAIEHGAFDVALVDLAEFQLPLLDEAAHPMQQHYEQPHTRLWSESVASADAYVFVAPEYDQFPPASLINALQVLMHEWSGKPAGIVSYGAGPAGGLRSSQVLRGLIGNLSMMALPGGVGLPMYYQHVGADGIFHPGEQMKKDGEKLLDELHRWSAALKSMRDALVMSIPAAA